ncbi:SDR family oxidoreductase [Geminicoccus harenae]|uniref:SDR family oxidoreductase n=1 Tax=Geminicoccus harenae TaxID=2498453 RepID=UPI00168B3906|nr:SDR family oxidoreductase [Geminicoccus harenae]
MPIPAASAPPSHGVVVVTGASAGVGRAVAHRLARDGCRIGLLARDAAALETVRAEIEHLGGQGLVLPADVADPDAVFAAAERVERELGPIDVWINDAMVTVFSRFWDLAPDEFRRVTEVTYLGFVHGTMAALRHMRSRDRGTIVQVGSALAYRGIPLQSAYCGAKHAIRGFTDSLRTELIHDGSRIRLTTVHLPAVNTPQFDWARTHMECQPRPAGQVYEPEVAAEAICHAAYHADREYWLGGSTDLAILGDMAAPGLADRYLAATTVEGQCRPAPAGPDRQDNLFQPVSGRHALRGSFSQEAKTDALRLTGSSARLLTAAGALGLAAMVGFTLRGRS